MDAYEKNEKVQEDIDLEIVDLDETAFAAHQPPQTE